MLFIGHMAMAQATFNTDPIIDWPMRIDPNVTPPPSTAVLPKTVHQMWKTALDRPELELRLAILQSIDKAQQMGISGLLDIYGMQVKSIAPNPKSSQPLAIKSVATLIELDDRSASDILIQFNKTGKTDWVLLTDSTLAKWQASSMNDLWLSRATNPKVSWALRNSALQQLTVTAPEKAQGPLRQLLGESSLDPLLKLAAAKALGQVAKRGLVADAKRLAKGDIPSRLMAIACLANHDSNDVTDVAVDLMTNRNEDPAVILAAGNLLLTKNPSELVKHAQALGEHADAGIRQLAGQCLIDQITAQRVPALAQMLNDANPQTRVMVREAMIKLAQRDALSDAIKSSALNILKQTQWQGQEQAALILGKLDIESSVDALFDVLDNATRQEARVAAATAIRWLDIDSQKTVALGRVQSLFASMKSNMASPHAMESAQLIQWFGQTQYEPATKHLLEYIPKNVVPSAPREAAVWSIGKIGKNQLTQNLGNKLMGRVKDTNEMNPESVDVQIAAIVTLVRLGHHSLINRFLSAAGTSMAMLDLQVLETCKVWAESVEAGKPYVMPVPEPVTASGWYLEPLKMSVDQ
tara:strand:- start:44341 stop:46083 length:1743 start_codon:yes stop_codon:yes gene_type:complete